MRSILVLIPLLFIFIGCSASNPFKSYELTPKEIEKEKTLEKVRDADYNQPYADTDDVQQNLNGAIVAIADQLFKTNTDKQRITSVILTSFADLNKLNKTTTFGRLLSESMFNELHIRKFKVTDFRGQDAVSVNADGEFHITRDVDKLKDHISATEYIMVGTYVKFERKSVLINARIIDSENGAILSTARVIYQPVDCSLFDICPKKKTAPEEPFGIGIVTDNCSKVGCPKQNCKDGICDNSTLY
jgi:TolB-like protein